MKGCALRHQGEAEPHGSGPGLRDENVVGLEEMLPAWIECGRTDRILGTAADGTQRVRFELFPIALRQTSCKDRKNIADLDTVVVLALDLSAMMPNLDRLSGIETRREGAAVEV